MASTYFDNMINSKLATRHTFLETHSAYDCQKEQTHALAVSLFHAAEHILTGAIDGEIPLKGSKGQPSAFYPTACMRVSVSRG